MTKSFAVTYTFVVEAETADDVPAATEEYVHSTSDVFNDPVSVEELAS